MLVFPSSDLMLSGHAGKILGYTNIHGSPCVFFCVTQIFVKTDFMRLVWEKLPFRNRSHSQGSSISIGIEIRQCLSNVSFK